uniref:Uncharacterized protein n=1 Tax=Branchiostoma floridae TaxID=7739 RepID=C3YYS9_BRAFL|eukprot:XP_002598425.1 hypothetical protein BRAFLDRAFT_83209 [Branchiostoma floridae]
MSQIPVECKSFITLDASERHPDSGDCRRAPKCAQSFGEIEGKWLGRGISGGGWTGGEAGRDGRHAGGRDWEGGGRERGRGGREWAEDGGWTKIYSASLTGPGLAECGGLKRTWPAREKPTSPPLVVIPYAGVDRLLGSAPHCVPPLPALSPPPSVLLAAPGRPLHATEVGAYREATAPADENRSPGPFDVRSR